MKRIKSATLIDVDIADKEKCRKNYKRPQQFYWRYNQIEKSVVLLYTKDKQIANLTKDIIQQSNRYVGTNVMKDN